MSDKCGSNELELYHFHFDALQLSADFRLLTKVLIKDTLGSLKELLIERKGFNSVDIEAGINALEEFLLKEIEEPLSDFKKAAKDIFDLSSCNYVPPYCENLLVVSEDELKSQKKEKVDLEDKYVQELCRQELLKQEERILSGMKPLYDKVENVLSYYKDSKRKDKSLQELFQALKLLRNSYFEKKNKFESLFNLFQCT